MLKHQLCTVTNSYSQDDIVLTRTSDGLDLSYGFKAADLAAAASGGTLLHLSLELNKPMPILRCILEADPSAAAAVDGAGRLPL